MKKYWFLSVNHPDVGCFKHFNSKEDAIEDLNVRRLQVKEKGGSMEYFDNCFSLVYGLPIPVIYGLTIDPHFDKDQL